MKRPAPKSRPKRVPPRQPARSRPEPQRQRADAPREKKPTERVPIARAPAHVIPLERLAELTLAIADEAEHAVLREHKRADRAIAASLKRRRDLGPGEHRFISLAVFSLFRWRGWIEPLRLRSTEARLLISVLLDVPVVHPVCRVWAKSIGRDPGGLLALGDAPDWPALAAGLRRLLGGQAITADPWRLFPAWLREFLPIPPGEGPPKLRLVELLWALQRRPSLWVRAQGAAPEVIWGELRDQGIKPWIHRHITGAARIDADVDVYHLPSFMRGVVEIQDLASQAVALACDPDPGERWWDACAGAGGKAIHLASLMQGKGVVIATDRDERRLKETVRRARRSPFRNISTKPWDGRHVVGKSGRYDGVLVDAPCSAIGTWRRNPDARWLLERDAMSRLATTQAELLHAAAAGVRPGGTLVYSVCTVTVPETQGVIRAFLQAHPSFCLDPFPDPISGKPTDGTSQIWPQEADCDAIYIARMLRAQ